jgi:uncharacterized protein (DUF2147 family)
MAPRLNRRALLALLSVLAAPLHAAGDITGTWLTEDGDSKVEIGAANGVYGGKLIWLKPREGQPTLDANDADAALRQRPLLGVPILAGFKAGVAGSYGGGTVYAPRSGKTYPAELTLLADGRLQLVVKAGLVSRKQHWTR